MKHIALKACGLALAILCGYIFMLGLDEFQRRNPTIDAIVHHIYVILIPLVGGALIVVSLVRFARGVREGMREARERALTNHLS